MLKKLLLNFCLFVLSLTLYSCFSNTCDLSGCEREATGWKYYETHQKGVFGGCIGACRMSDSGGYCSKDHVLKDR
jgi:hypothetical protein